MVTSRTGTAKYLRNRRRVLTDAQRAGITHCPGYAGHPCGRPLDYRTRAQFDRDEPHRAGQSRPDQAVTDHVVPVARGGRDDVENLTVLCTACNLAKGDGGRTAVPIAKPEAFPLTRSW